MSREGKCAARRATVALTCQQVASILMDMGWEDEDAATFWRLARRETRHPGCLHAERRKYWQPFITEGQR